jgi:TRAP-type mannitol/chloroaromatic compound transport system permease large subunit
LRIEDRSEIATLLRARRLPPAASNPDHAGRRCLTLQGDEIRLTKIYLGAVPFPVAPLILISLMFFFPGIALRLPKARYG